MQIGKTLLLSTLLAAGMLWVQDRVQLPASARVAVVNMQTVLDGYNDGKRRMDDLKKQLEEYQQRISDQLKEWEKLRDQHKQVNAERTVFKPGTTEYRLKTAQMERLARQADAIEGEASAMRQTYDADLERRKAELVVQIHTEIKDKVAILARTLKIDLVLRVGEDAADDPAEVKAVAMTRRQVIFHDRNLEITKDVIALLNTNTGGVQDAAQNNSKK